MTAAGGLWASAADLAKFLEFQLGDGTVDGRTVLDAALMQEMRTVPAPNAGAPAGYALGVARTHWRAGQYLDLFNHGGGGYGFLSDLWWLPQLQLGIAVLTNSDDHDLQGALALGILRDLVTEPDSRYHDRMLGLPTQSDVVEPDSHYVAPPDLADRIAAVAMPASSEQSARWAGYPELYRTGQLGAMNPDYPPSRFHVESGVPYFDAAEDGTPVRHRLTEFQPGLFLADNGETLDLRGPSPRWRGVDLNPVTNGPLAWQWALLAVVVVVAAGWLVAGLRRVGTPTPRSWPVVDGRCAAAGGRTGRRLTTTVAAAGALAALVTVAAIRAMPGLVDVGFLGWMAFPLPVRLAFHLPLAVTLLAAGPRRAPGGRRPPALVDPADPAARRGPRRRLDRPRGPARVLAPGRLGVLTATATTPERPTARAPAASRLAAPIAPIHGSPQGPSALVDPNGADAPWSCGHLTARGEPGATVTDLPPTEGPLVDPHRTVSARQGRRRQGLVGGKRVQPESHGPGTRAGLCLRLGDGERPAARGRLRPSAQARQPTPSSMATQSVIARSSADHAVSDRRSVTQIHRRGAGGTPLEIRRRAHCATEYDKPGISGSSQSRV